ncbi:MAG: DoxX family protein [Candidatus Omnitrophica bacterium]|nr:DoxX family protein [Candidatus Omnitrophota bacterium]
MAEFGIFLLRVTVGALMVFGHGWPKFQKVLAGDPVKFPDPLGLGGDLSFYLVVGAEFFCSILLILGLFTRLSLIPLAFTMCVAAFIQHSGDPFPKVELPLLYLGAYLTLLCTGAGSFRLQDKILSVRSNNRVIDFLFN